MTSRIKEQEEICVTQQIVSIVREINDLHGVKKIEVARKLGVRPETIYRALDGKGGSKQLLFGLRLLSELLQLRAKANEVEAARDAILRLTNPPAAPFTLNEPPIADASSKQKAADDARQQEILEGELSYKKSKRKK